MSSLIAYIVHSGMPLVVLAVGLESLGLPLPGETLIIAFGTAAGAEHISITGFFLAVWAGAVAGDNIGYLIGRRYGKHAILKLGKPMGLQETRLTVFEARFRRYGSFVVLIARFFAILRQLNGVIAGSLELPWWQFLAANVAGAGLWVGFWLYASSYLSSHFAGLPERIYGLKLGLYAVIGIIAAGAVIILYRRLRKPRR